ncbi:unnamed protein product [Miscanthus lutarioriparius]|uniref:RING-type domain-containing protein n=1 Tax=Miscanthus lutarioriparius TaxID=422564 RepID=A0A811S8Z0_9POAL|nr:unnamed protein product [Miscanthus lutarioriparius]
MEPVDGEDDDFLDQQPDQGDDFMSDDDDFVHQQPGQGEEEDYFMSDDDDDYWSTDDDDDNWLTQGDDDDEEYPFPVHAPAAAASEAAIAALEAAEAPADDCCPVCLQDGGEAPEPEPASRPWSRVAPCGHRFHAACVEKWLRVKLACPVCRFPAAPAAACRRDAAPEPPPPRPIPDIVEEFLALGYEESLVFDKSPRWMEYMADLHQEFFPSAGAA